MNVIIESAKIETTGKYFNLVCGKKSAFVGVSECSVTVCVKNAAHKVWRGVGRTFLTMDDAQAAYKSAEVKAMLDCVKDVA